MHSFLPSYLPSFLPSFLSFFLLACLLTFLPFFLSSIPRASIKETSLDIEVSCKAFEKSLLIERCFTSTKEMVFLGFLVFLKIFLLAIVAAADIKASRPETPARSTLTTILSPLRVLQSFHRSQEYKRLIFTEMD